MAYAFHRPRPAYKHGPDFTGQYPPYVVRVGGWLDEDFDKHPTVKKLVKRGSWPSTCLYQPSMQQIADANAALYRIWAEGYAENVKAANSKSLVVKSPAIPTTDAAPGAIIRRTSNEPNGNGASTVLTDLRDQIRAEILGEMEEEKKAKEEADAAEKAKDEYEAKLKEEAGSAAVAAYIAEQEAKMASIAMSTRQTYCYHECGNHPSSSEPMWDGQPSNKGKGKEKEKGWDKITPPQKVSEDSRPGASMVASSSKGKSAENSKGPATTCKNPSVGSSPAGPMQSAASQTVPSSRLLPMSSDRYPSFSTSSESDENSHRASSRRSKGGWNAPTVGHEWYRPKKCRHSTSKTHRHERRSESSEGSSSDTTWDPSVLPRYYYREPVIVAPTRFVPRRHGANEPSFADNCRSAPSTGAAYRAPPGRPGNRPGDNLVPEAVTYQQRPLQPRSHQPSSSKDSKKDTSSSAGSSSKKKETRFSSDELSRLFES